MRTYTGRGSGKIIEDIVFSAKKYVLLCSPYISPSYAKRLLMLTNHGVQLRVITTDDNYKDKYGSNTRTLLSEAVKPQKNLLGRVKKDWIRPSLDYKVINRDFVHAKIYVVDGEHALVGSSNFTYSGLWNNIEHVIVAEDLSEVQMFEDDYNKIWNSYGGNETIDEHMGIFGRIFGKR